MEMMVEKTWEGREKCAFPHKTCILANICISQNILNSLANVYVSLRICACSHKHLQFSRIFWVLSQTFKFPQEYLVFFRKLLCFPEYFACSYKHLCFSRVLLQTFVFPMKIFRILSQAFALIKNILLLTLMRDLFILTYYECCAI